MALPDLERHVFIHRAGNWVAAPLGQELIETRSADVPGAFYLRILIVRFYDPIVERLIPDLELFDIFQPRGGTCETPTLFEEVDDMRGECLLRLRVGDKRLEYLCADLLGSFVYTLEGLELPDKAIRIFTQSDGENRDLASHSIAKFLI